MINRISLSRIIMMTIAVILVGILIIVFLQIESGSAKPLSYEVIEQQQETMQQKIQEIQQRNRLNSGPATMAETHPSPPDLPLPPPIPPSAAPPPPPAAYPAPAPAWPAPGTSYYPPPAWGYPAYGPAPGYPPARPQPWPAPWPAPR